MSRIDEARKTVVDHGLGHTLRWTTDADRAERALAKSVDAESTYDAETAREERHAENVSETMFDDAGGDVGDRHAMWVPPFDPAE